ncbi:tryptophan halogenase family protein [Asticcacaulis machinosus]|uniref:Tryptophan 7-halogenase n=1 Tax=Asticcacaulis machinosus TaxID=2984211 RepID=A0ABT5HI93_9CAUL|nr:tryptophan halogenase family protein [Asticcacaulis machinosus]MDC7675918.1 tryptophan 7-halogenase [Asticcacaulis machinosus]
MQTSHLERIVIVGGGTAGWMTAAALSQVLKGTATRVVLIESEEIGTVGVGEATVPSIIGFNRLLELDEREFFLQTKGSIKLGIQFCDWYRPGASYIHPFGTFPDKLGYCEFQHYWLRARQQGLPYDLGDFSLNVVMAKENRFAPPTPDQRSPLSTTGYAYHFDAGLYAKYLRNYAERRGVERIEGKISQAHLDGETGFIASVELETSARISGDLFIDCSGFRGLLIEQALKTGYEDWSDLLPCNSAVAVPCESAATLTPYTRATAREAGWQWRIPLQHRIGNGYVYSDNYISDDEAVSVLMTNLDGKALADPRVIRFQSGRRKMAWNKNCIAIGLSSGFLEPLESTSIHLIQKGIIKLIQCLPRKHFPASLVNEYNREVRRDYESVRDFLVLHYKANLRDGRFWQDCRNRQISDQLTARIELFSETGRLSLHDQELFKGPSWLSVFIGQNIFPSTYDPLAEAVPLPDLMGSLNGIRSTFQDLVSKLPSHQQFLQHQIDLAGR